MKRFKIVLPPPVSMMRTRYSAGNIALLVMALLIGIFNYSYVGLILASMNIPARGARRVDADLFALVAALDMISVLVGFRWPAMASTALWSLLFFWFVLAVAMHILPVMLVPAALLGVVAAIASAVEHFSKKKPQAA